MSKVNTQSIPVLRAAIAGALSSVAVMEATKLGAKPVAGALRNLRNCGLISGTVDQFRVLKAGERYVASIDAKPNEPTQIIVKQAAAVGDGERSHNRRTKIGKALTLFDRHQHQGRQAVLEKFQSKLDMTEGGASTYYQLCRKERGMAGREGVTA